MTGANNAGEARASNCDQGCPPRNRLPNGQHTDSAKRTADGVNLVIAAQGTAAIGRWLVIKLADGSVDCTLYAEQSDAVGAAWPYEREHCYLKIPRQWMTLCEAESYLRFCRLRYDAGMGTMPDPREVIRPVTQRDADAQIAAMARALGQMN